MTFSRRNFLKFGALATLSGIASPAPVRSQSRDDRLRVGFIGVGPMGRSDCLGFAELGHLVALCDLDEKYAFEPAMKLKRIREASPELYSDYRKILDRKDIDLVGIATPDHWHIKIAVEALMAGKHVFCEKPLTLTVDEGRQIRRACERYPDRVFQVGTMQRAMKLFQTAVLIVRKGFLGKIERIVCHIDGAPESPTIPKAVVPSTLDWNVWLGQAPETGYIATEAILEKFGCPLHTRGHHEFRWFFDYAGGKFTDWGAHHVDIALWALEKDSPDAGNITLNPVIAKHPVPMKDGNPTVTDRYQTATAFKVECLTADGVRLEIASDSKEGHGIYFQGSKGRLHVNRERIKGNAYETLKVQEKFTEDDYRKLGKGWISEDKRALITNKANMISCIKNGGEPISDVRSHIQSLNLCHVACIATRLGRPLTWNPATESFVDDPHADGFLKRDQRKGFEVPEFA